jgi:hypothetical protein
MIEDHLQQSDFDSTDDIKQEDQIGHSARLEIAIRVVDLSWAMLSEVARDLNIDTERPQPKDPARREYFEIMKWGALELADGIYWSGSEGARRKDDRDLERFETAGIIEDRASPRIQALALLTFAKELVETQQAGR